jgi:hypothetical protein
MPSTTSRHPSDILRSASGRSERAVTNSSTTVRPFRRPELKQEMIDHHRQPLLVGDNRTQAGRRHRLLECAVEPGQAGELEQLPVQLDTARNQGVHVGSARH